MTPAKEVAGDLRRIGVELDLGNAQDFKMCDLFGPICEALFGGLVQTRHHWPQIISEKSCR